MLHCGILGFLQALALLLALLSTGVQGLALPIRLALGSLGGLQRLFESRLRSLQILSSFLCFHLLRLHGPAGGLRLCELRLPCAPHATAPLLVGLCGLLLFGGRLHLGLRILPRRLARRRPGGRLAPLRRGLALGLLGGLGGLPGLGQLLEGGLHRALHGFHLLHLDRALLRLLQTLSKPHAGLYQVLHSRQDRLAGGLCPLVRLGNQLLQPVPVPLSAWLDLQQVLLRRLQLTLPEVVVVHGVLQLIQGLQSLPQPVGRSIRGAVASRSAPLVHDLQLLGGVRHRLAEILAARAGGLHCLHSVLCRRFRRLIGHRHGVLLLKELVLECGEVATRLLPALLRCALLPSRLRQL
mmetsp:Transcript_85338/g.204430  ORF Transcript_85338/g.204430 Transcript_85338/m.204430 type:complete len:353 (+) Transcript_85338:173-1231(+)